MGAEEFEECIIVANSGTVFIRGGFGREECWLGLSHGRAGTEDNPDVLVELTPLQQERLVEALLDTRPSGEKCRPITEMERTLSDAIQAACRELEDGTEAQFVAGRAPPFAQAAWRILQDAAVALEKGVWACTSCGVFVSSRGDCSECLGDGP